MVRIHVPEPRKYQASAWYFRGSSQRQLASLRSSGGMDRAEVEQARLRERGAIHVLLSYLARHTRAAIHVT